MMKLNDFQKYEITLKIPYEDYFSLIYDTKYLLEARLSADRCFIAHVPIYANNRRKAVQKSVEWFNKELRAVLINADKVMTVEDPFKEVSYDEGFTCSDPRNKFLDDDTIERILSEAGGDLVRESPDSLNTQHNCFRRVKRRKKENIQLTKRLTQTPGGTIYYKMSEPIEGKVSTRMKTTSIKLSSKSLEKALREVTRRGLNKFEKFERVTSPKKKLPASQKAA